MFIKIGNDYALETDPHNWIISKRYINEEGEVSYKNLSYYSSFESAVNGLASRKLRLSGATTMKQAIADMEAISKEISESLSPKLRVSLEKG